MLNKSLLFSKWKVKQTENDLNKHEIAQRFVDREHKKNTVNQKDFFIPLNLFICIKLTTMM